MNFRKTRRTSAVPNAPPLDTNAPTVLSFLEEHVHVEHPEQTQTIKKRKSECEKNPYEHRFIFPGPNQFNVLMKERKTGAEFRHLTSGNNACVPICLLFLHWIFNGKEIKELVDKAEGYMKGGIVLWVEWFNQTKNNDRNVTPKEFIDYLDKTKKNELLMYFEEETEIPSNIDEEIVRKMNTPVKTRENYKVREEVLKCEKKFLSLKEIFLKYLEKTGDAGILIIHDSSKLIFRSNERFFLFDSHGSRKTKNSDRCFFIELTGVDELVEFIECMYHSKEEVFNALSFTKVRSRMKKREG